MLALGVVLVVAGGLSRWWLLLAVGAALGLLVGAESLLVRRERTLTAARRVSPLVVLRGEPSRGVLEAVLPPTPVTLDRTAVDLVDGRPELVDLPWTRSRDEVSADYAIATPHRGLITVGPLVVVSSGPLGLARCTARVGGTAQVRVLPRPARVHTLPAGHRRADTGVDERVDRGGTDLVGLHEYEPGDDLRLVHWASSARTGQLMVREDADPATPHLLLLLDDRADAYGPQAADDFEEAVDFVSGLAECGLEHGRHVRFQTLSGTIDIEVGARSPQATSSGDPRIAHALAEVGLVPGDTIASTSSRDQDIVVLVTGTEVPDTEVALLLAGANHPVLARIDPTLSRTAIGPSGVITLRAANAAQLAGAWETAT